MLDRIKAAISYVANGDSLTNGALFVIFLATIGALWGVRNRRAREEMSPSLYLALVFGSLCSLNDGMLRWLAFGLAIVSSISHWASHRRVSSRSSPSKTAAYLFSGLGLLAVAFLLFYRLVPNFIIPLVWESTVIHSFLFELQTFNLPEALLRRFLWSEGLLSEGDASLLYGFPTALLLSVHSSLFSLRIFSVIFFLAAALLMGVFCKRFAHAGVGAAACVVFGLNELGLVFGRYGSSIAATLLSVVVAFLCCALTVARPTIFRVGLTVTAMFIATLGYAPARLVVLALIVMTLVGLCSNTSISSCRRLLLTTVLCLGVGSVFLLQRHFTHAQLFVSARQEQFFKLFNSGMWPDPLLQKWRAFKEEKREPRFADYLSFGGELVVNNTLPQLLELTLPFDKAASDKRKFSVDPLFLELYAPYLFPFLLIGILMVSSYFPRWVTQTLLVWCVAALVPVLLTNRADSYRTSMALIPISLWIAVGIAETMHEFRKTLFPTPLMGAVLCAALAAITESRMHALSVPHVPPTPSDMLVESLPPRFINGAILAVEEQEFRRAAQSQLLLLRRQQIGLPIPREILSAAKYQALTSSAESAKELHEQVIIDMTKNLQSGSAVVLGPRASMETAIREITARVSEISPTLREDGTVVILKESP
jgi:hypothetical protein